MERIVHIELPLPHVGSVNAWLLHGSPLTLVDTGPKLEPALAALEQGLAREGLRVDHARVLTAHVQGTGLGGRRDECGDH